MAHQTHFLQISPRWAEVKNNNSLLSLPPYRGCHIFPFLFYLNSKYIFARRLHFLFTLPFFLFSLTYTVICIFIYVLFARAALQKCCGRSWLIFAYFGHFFFFILFTERRNEVIYAAIMIIYASPVVVKMLLNAEIALRRQITEEFVISLEILHICSGVVIFIKNILMEQ